MSKRDFISKACIWCKNKFSIIEFIEIKLLKILFDSTGEELSTCQDCRTAAQFGVAEQRYKR